MRLRVEPGGVIAGATAVPGDKSIAHRWLLLAATAMGTSHLRGLPAALDVGSTASAVGAMLGSTDLDPWNGGDVSIAGAGFAGLGTEPLELDCGNSGTTMRLLAGVLAGRPAVSTLCGDDSLSARPMERVAEPLRRMGAEITTADGHAPIAVRGGSLVGIAFDAPVPSAQIKSAILLAGLQADGTTVVTGAGATRDHTERALAALGAPVQIDAARVGIAKFQHQGFEGDVPGDPSSAAFLLAAAAVTGGDVAVRDVGLNPTRTAFVEILGRMGASIRTRELWESLREPAGVLEIGPGTMLRPTVVTAEELPSIIDEVPVLAAVAAHAPGETRFEGASELRVKESDRLLGVAEGLRDLGGDAEVQGDTLVVRGGSLGGGTADARGDHRLAMAFAVAALGGTGDSFVNGMESADVSYPGFVETLISLGALAEPA